jgi:hypothetical protein
MYSCNSNLENKERLGAGDVLLFFNRTLQTFKTAMTVDEEITKAFEDPEMQEQIKNALKHIPEIKLENYITNLLAVKLSKLQESGDGKSKYFREQRYIHNYKSRRADLCKVNLTDKDAKQTIIEVKYHFEGDLILVHSYLHSKVDDLLRELDELKKTKSKKGSKTQVPKEVLSDLLGAGQYFIWHICIRPKNLNSHYKYPGISKIFYDHVNRQSESLTKEGLATQSTIEVAKATVEQINEKINTNIRFIKCIPLQVIEVKSLTNDPVVLLSYLYILGDEQKSELVNSLKMWLNNSPTNKEMLEQIVSEEELRQESESEIENREM